MKDCEHTADGLLDYAKDDFGTQFSFKDNVGLTPLGLSFSHSIPIDYIGLTPPTTFVTPEVVENRKKLANSL